MTPNLPSTPPSFDGQTFVQERDHSRLFAQLARVKEAMTGAGPLTLDDIAQKTGDPVASIGSRVRDLRKAKFGGHTVERRYLAKGLFTYELVTK